MLKRVRGLRVAPAPARRRATRLDRRASAGAAVGLITLVAIVVTGCGSSSSQQSTSTHVAASHGAATSSAAASSSTQSNGCNMSAAQQNLAHYRNAPPFTAPGPAFPASRSRGKVIYDIPVSSQIPFINLVDQNMAAEAKNLGMKFVIYPNQGQPSQWTQGMDQAINAHADAIILDGAPDPRVLQPQILQAKAAGIPVIPTHNYDVTDATDSPANLRPPNLAAVVPTGFTTVAKLEVDQAVVDTGCKAQIVAIEAKDLPTFLQMVTAAKQELATTCGSGCSLSVLNVPVVDWATRMQPDLQAELTAHQNVNWVIPFVDGMAQYAVPAVVASGKAGQVKMSTFNGTPFALKDVADHKILASDIGEDLTWLAWANLDQTMRVMQHLPPVASENTALRIFDASNVAETGNPPTFNKGFGTPFVQGYTRLWELK